MGEIQANVIPSLYIQGKDEESTKLVLKLTMAKSRFVVRFTGGCGEMSASDAEGLYDLFVNAFIGFDGAILFGGTRMVMKNDKNIIVPGITEIPPLIKQKSKDAIILGVVPKTGDVSISMDYGMIVSNEDKNDFITLLHPDQDICLLVQQSVDQGVSWEAEFEECIKITKNLKDYAGWKSLLISYNGGGVTEKEILKTAKLGWPVLLIKGSGRKTDEYANNKEFLLKHPNVVVADKSVQSIRDIIFGDKEQVASDIIQFRKRG